MNSDERGEREKLSWSEIDKRRGRARTPREDRPGGKQAREQAARESRQALAAAAALFAGEAGGGRAAALAKAVRDAHGSPGLAPACRAYESELGMPASAELLAIFLDVAERDWRVRTLEALRDLAGRGALEMGAGLKSQLRLLCEDADDDIAGLAGDLLG